MTNLSNLSTINLGNGFAATNLGNDHSVTNLGTNLYSLLQI